MKTVFILGAGASREAGGPLMADFLDKADKLYRLRPDRFEKKAFENVRNARSELQSVFAKANLETDNLEVLFGAIEMAEIIQKFCNREPSTIAGLRDSIIKVIVATLEWTIKFPESANYVDAPEPYGDFAKVLAGFKYRHGLFNAPSPEFAIITFNYDVAIDYALAVQKLSYNYCLDDADAGTESLPLLKLHGSINWGRCAECQAIDPLRIQPIEIPPLAKGDAGHVFLPEHWNSFREKLPKQPHCNTHLRDIPVLVPPTWSKSQHYLNLAPVWKRAARELGEAENIFVIGYSLPETDMFFRYLYALGSQSNTRIRRFWVFDPDKENVEGRFRKLIGRGIEKRFDCRPKRFSQAIPDIEQALREDVE